MFNHHQNALNRNATVDALPGEDVASFQQGARFHLSGRLVLDRASRDVCPLGGKHLAVQPPSDVQSERQSDLLHQDGAWKHQHGRFSSNKAFIKRKVLL